MSPGRSPRAESRCVAALAAALLFFFGSSSCGCTEIKLDQYPRPFACDRNGGDGGVQCADGWTCGYDDRCFQKDLVLDGGQHVDLWQCANDEHCPTGWKCGQEVESVRNCQQRGVGAPSPCVDDDGGCEGGWRCAATERCFDPTIRDAGATRECTRDGECPNGYRCGQRVDLVQLCIELDAGAPSLCNDDEGCEGTYRCNTATHRCDDVTDVITTGQASAFGAQELNPRVHEGAPLHFAMSREAQVPLAFGFPAAQNREGIFFASLFDDGGLRVSAQFKEEKRPDAGPTAVLHDLHFGLPHPVADVTELALSATNLVVVRYADGGSQHPLPGGGWSSPLPATFLRQRDPLPDPMLGPLMLTETLRVVGDRVQREDGGFFSFTPGMNELVSVRDAFYALSDGGFFSAVPPGAPARLINEMDGGSSITRSSRGAVAGLMTGLGPLPRLVLYSEVTTGGGGIGILRNAEMTAGWRATVLSAACPDGGSPLQLSIGRQDDEPQLYARCGTPAASFPVKVIDQGPGRRAEFEGVVEDQVPFQTGLVPQRTSAFVRAHAGAEGRAWYASDPDGLGLSGGLGLRALILDRQPDSMLSFRDFGSQTIRVFAEANDTLFSLDPNGGFVSQLNEGDVVPLSFIPGEQNWIITKTGAIDASGNKPRLMASLPAGARFVPPAPGATVTLQLAGQQRKVIVVASGDTVWTADVTEAQGGPFAQPAVFQRALVPVPGVPLRSLVLLSSNALSGYLTTSTQNLAFGSTDLVRWSQSPVNTPQLEAVPLEVWTEADGGARTGFSDGVVWSLPIMVPLTQPLSTDGGLSANDFGRKCGDLFTATSQGLFHAELPGDGGLPAWSPVTLPVTLESTRGLRLYETRDDVDRLFIGTQKGQVVELSATCQEPSP